MSWSISLWTCSTSTSTHAYGSGANNGGSDQHRTRPGRCADTCGERRAGWTRVLFTNPVTVISAVFLLLVVLAAAFAPMLTPYDPTFLDPAVRLQGPSLDHPLGTDDRGRDIFSRVIYGGRVSFMICLSVTLAP